MKTKYLAFAAAAFMLASCSNDEDFVPQDSLKDTPITVTVGVEGMLTRAGYDTEILPITFYLTVDQEGTSYDYTNVLMTKNAGIATYSAPEGTTLLWKDGNHEAAVVNAYTTNATTFTVQTDQSTTDGVLASDLLGAVKTDEEVSDINISGNNIAVDFRHLLCKFDVTFSWGSELEVETITDKSIKSVKYVGFGSEVSIDRAAASVESNDATADIVALVTDMTSEAIFAPYVGETPKIVITIETTTSEDGAVVTAERVFSINVNAPTGGFVSGNRYTMNVTIGGTAAETGEIGIAEGWETGDANGEAEGTNGNMETN
ncbi:fimbrillin family protein [Bacteroides sp.]|uniref:fimbrillin family protein n=1 Tax=Bacteroides sp. TaxID=29523 RepID=UPI002A828E3E|nr:fimbrillin family protein [Bacteroides sp.]